ncbi:MAG: DUF748 domain-containing protein [Bacteroidales bacterium]|nr:DUF748 domain-containing protein [Bacteroidales bacterium]
MKKGLRILLWVVGIVLALVIIVSLLAGPIAKGYVNGHGEELTGRKVHVEHVGLNLLTGTVNVRGLDVYEDDGEEVFAGFDTLDVRAHLLQIPFKVINLRHITLSGLHANIIQEGKRFNFASLIEHFSSDDSTEVEDTTPSGWVMKFYNINIRHASLNYDDMLNHKGIHLPDINLSVPGFVLGGDEGSEGGLNIGFDKGGRLNVDANYDTKESLYHVDVNLEDFSVQNLDSYLADMLRYDDLRGSVNAHITADGNVNDIMKSSIGGTVAVNGVDLTGSKGPVASFDALTVKVNNINLDDNSFDIGEVRLNGLKATYEQWKEYSNISLLMPKKESQGVTLQSGIEEDDDKPAEEAKGKTGKPMQLHVGSLRVEDASVTYNDHTLPDEFHFPVTGLSVSADDLTTAGGNNAQVRATLPGGGHLMVRWKGDIVNWKNYQDLFLTIKGLDMRQISPWAVAYTGYPVEDGTFGLTTRLAVNNSELDNQNKIDIYKAKVGDRRKDVSAEVKIPLKAALYILKDKDDKILIEMPVKGNIDNPEFNYMKVVWKTLGNLLVKVATSPARALGSALGINSDELEFMVVAPDQHGLTSEQYHILSDLSAIAQSDPRITITLTLHMPATDDAEAAAKRNEWLNEQVARYVAEQGVPEGRIVVVTGEPLTDKKAKAGYAITSEMQIEE